MAVKTLHVAQVTEVCAPHSGRDLSYLAGHLRVENVPEALAPSSGNRGALRRILERMKGRSWGGELPLNILIRKFCTASWAGHKSNYQVIMHLIWHSGEMAKQSLHGQSLMQMGGHQISSTRHQQTTACTSPCVCTIWKITKTFCRITLGAKAWNFQFALCV